MQLKKPTDFIIATGKSHSLKQFINIAAKEEVIPELLQTKCNAKNIFETVSNFINNPNKMKAQINKTQLILEKLKSSSPSALSASKILIKYL